MASARALPLPAFSDTLKEYLELWDDNGNYENQYHPSEWNPVYH